MRIRNKPALLMALGCVLVLGIFGAQKGITVWPFGSDKQELLALLEPAAGTLLEGAEIRAWTPDLNLKAQSYFIAGQMSEANFKTWAKAANLSLSQTTSIPDGVFVLPSGIAIGRWLPDVGRGINALDAQGSTSRAMVWSRWQDGTAYTVLHPTVSVRESPAIK